MPLCAVIVITSHQDTEKSECGPRESWDSESPSPMRNGEMSMMCLTDVKLMPRFVRYLDHRT